MTDTPMRFEPRNHAGFDPYTELESVGLPAV